MKVYGYEVTEGQLKAATNYMRGSVTFGAKDIQAILMDAGVPEFASGGLELNLRYCVDFVAHRVADRFIQKLRKEGKIELISNATWQWIV